MISAIFWVATGGALGAIGRVFCMQWLARRESMASFYALLWVNAVGCILAGLLFGVLSAAIPWNDQYLVTFAMVGFLGSYTSVSAFGLETFLLLTQRRWFTALSYVLASMVLCWTGFAGGWLVARAALGAI